MVYYGNYSATIIVPTAWKYTASSVMQSSTTPLFTDSVWVDGWPQETEGPGQDLYNGSVYTYIGRVAIARHGGLLQQALQEHNVEFEFAGWNQHRFL